MTLDTFWKMGWSGVALCASACSAPSLGPQIGYTLSDAHEPRPAKKIEKRPLAVPEDIVEQSRLPFSGQRTSDGNELSEAELFDELARADVVCIGEHHDDPHHHFAELAVLEGLLPRAGRAGRALGIGFEMFQRPFQRVLDQYSSGKIDEAELLAETEYEERWGFPIAYYRPLLELSRTAGLRLVALNAPRELTRKVAREGLEALDQKERAKLPALNMSDVDHRSAFEAAMAGHPKGKSDPENYYAAQVLWDETMAQAAATWLEKRAPARQLVIVAGRAHCRNSAIPSRIERRSGAEVKSLTPMLPADQEQDARALGYDYALVFETETAN